MTVLTVPTPGGVALNARIDGPEGAPWVIFANSVLTDLTVWDAQAAALSGRYRVLRFDQRGHGASTVTTGAMDFARYGADLLAVMDTAGMARGTVVGLSMGCPTALAAWSAAPERFDAVVAVDGVMRSAPGRGAFWAERRETALRDGMDAIADSTAPRWLPGEDTGTALSRRLRAMIAATDAQGFAAATHALSDYDQTAAPQCPVLAIAGAEDGAMPETMQRQFGPLPDARIATIPGAGHLPNFQKPQAFNTILAGFLDQITTKESP